MHDEYTKMLDTVRGALVCDPRSSYAIAKLSGLSQLTLGNFRSGRQAALSIPALMALTPHVLPGMGFGLHKVTPHAQ